MTAVPVNGPSSRPTTVSVVDNHEAILRGIAALSAEHDDLQLCDTYTDVTQVPIGEAEPPDVLLLDLYLGRDDKVSTHWIPRLNSWGTAVLLYTSSEVAQPLRSAIAAGAAGLSLKNDGPDALYAAIMDVAAGDFACSSELAQALLSDPRLMADLSRREVDVIRGLDQGLTHDALAKRLGVAPSTVKEHLKSVRQKYMLLGRDITNAHSIVREARRDGWLGR